MNFEFFRFLYNFKYMFAVFLYKNVLVEKLQTKDYLPLLRMLPIVIIINSTSRAISEHVI